MHTQHPQTRFETTDSDLSLTEDYHTTIKLIRELFNMGVIDRSGGYCFGISDMMKSLLEQRGIKSHLEECQLTILGIDPPSFAIIGQTGLLHNNRSSGQQVDTHIVCVTDTEIPMIIDLSVHGFRDEIPFICERLNGRDRCLADLDFGTSRWTYQRKEIPRLAGLHQKSMLDRIDTDRTVKKKINFLMICVVLLFLIVTVNAIRGAYDFYQVYVNKENNWGPQQMQQLENKINDLEKLMKVPVDQRKSLN